MEDFEGLLKGVQPKVTPKRRAVLEVMAAESTFLSPEELQRKMGASGRNVGLPTVYRILDELANGSVW